MSSVAAPWRDPAEPTPGFQPLGGGSSEPQRGGLCSQLALSRRPRETTELWCRPALGAERPFRMLRVLLNLGAGQLWDHVAGTPAGICGCAAALTPPLMQGWAWLLLSMGDFLERMQHE